MLSANRTKEHYQLTKEDELRLKGLQPLMKQHRDGFSDDFYEFVMSYEETADFFADKERYDRHKLAIAGWFTRLFSGTYDEAYFRYLRHVGKIHVNINLDSHYVNTAMARARQFITEIIQSQVPEEERGKISIAVGKLLDMNLDVLTSSYRQAELKKYFLSFRFESRLINWMERFTHGLSLILAFALAIVSLAVVGLFINDIVGIFGGSKIENGVIAALGSLLIIWMMIELLETEISHLKGRKIPIKIFVGVVLVAFIRKVLIGTFQHEQLLEYSSKVGTLFILGIVYWLITRADRG